MVIELPLSQGKIALIDETDSDLASRKWYAHKENSHTFYARHNTNINNVQWRLHIVILERMIGRKLEKHERCDHKDGDGLNNQRSNLRVASPSQQRANASRHKPTASPYKGVQVIDGRCYARITVNSQRILLGRFDTPELAHEAYKQAAIEHFGEFARFE